MVNSELSLRTNLVQAKVYKDNNLKPSNNARDHKRNEIGNRGIVSRNY